MTLDGNVLAGPLAAVFAVELTAATGTCAHCGARGVLAQADVYTDAPGLVARCRACAEVLLRLATGDGRSWLDLRGLSVLEIPTS